MDTELSESCPPVSVVADLQSDTRFCHLRTPPGRFYAGVPIRTPEKINIGVYCVYDESPRPSGLREDEIQFLQEMSLTVMEHLEFKRSNRRCTREDRLVYGLGSFVEGRDSLSSSLENLTTQSSTPFDAIVPQPTPPADSLIEEVRGLDLESTNPTVFGSADENGSVTGSYQEQGHADFESSRRHSIISQAPSVASIPRARSGSSRASPTDLLRREIEGVFSKAANIMRESIAVDGVLFLDATIRSFGGLVDQTFAQPVLARTPSSRK